MVGFSECDSEFEDMGFPMAASALPAVVSIPRLAQIAFIIMCENTFTAFDANADGFLSQGELSRGLRHVCQPNGNWLYYLFA